MIKKIFLIIKNNILLMGLVGILIGLLSSWILYEGLHRTSDDRFCIVCHEMKPMVAAYHNDVHGGNGKVGIKVSCVTCHLPHDNVMPILQQKLETALSKERFTSLVILMQLIGRQTVPIVNILFVMKRVMVVIPTIKPMKRSV